MQMYDFFGLYPMLHLCYSWYLLNLTEVIHKYLSVGMFFTGENESSSFYFLIGRIKSGKRSVRFPTVLFLFHFSVMRLAGAFVSVISC